MNSTTQPIAIGIIGGSGFYEMEGFTQIEEVDVDTPFGQPSDSYITGKLDGVKIAFLPRHGRGHLHLPTEVNYRANIYGFKKLGVKNLISISAVGSLREDRPPMDLVIPDQLIDRTRQRDSTFFGDGVVAHVSFANPFCPTLSATLHEAAKTIVKRVHLGGTLVTMEGPAFSTKAESHLYRSWGCDIIGMTTCQEAKLSREAEICYTTLSMVTDYDCWKDSPADEVTVSTVVANMQNNSSNARAIIKALIPKLASPVTCSCHNSLEGAIMTSPDKIDTETREKLNLLIGHRLG